MLTIYRSETSASLRRVPVWLVGSTGTAPDTDETGGQPQVCWHARGTTTVNTSGTLSLVSANAGLYHVELTASEVSALGVLSVMYRSATAIANVSFAQVVNYDSGDSMRAGLFALPNVQTGAAGGLITEGTGTGQISLSAGSVGLKAQTHSQVTITGINNILAGNYSDVSFSVRAGGIQVTSVGAGNYSGVSVEVKSKGIAVNSIETATAYSHLTIQGISNYANISNVTLAAGTHSDVTIKGIQNYANISNVTLHAGTHSNVTIQGVTRVNSSVTPADALYSAVTMRLDIAQSFSGVTVDGVRMIAAPGQRSLASSYLSTVLGGTRLVQEAYFVLRNRVQISGSTMTVFHPDDSTSAFTATVSTGTATIYQIDPGIA
jgi:hypothetical protein